MSVTITDTGLTRIVEVDGEQRGFGGPTWHSRIETHYSRETLEAILAVKGEMYLADEIARAEEPSYIEEPLRRQFERFVPIHGLRVLDFGSGCGGSSLCLVRLGVASVVGVEPRADFVHLARLRARDSDAADKAVFHHLPDTARLPFEDGAFEVVVMNAVLEHISPRDRGRHLREIWRVIADGGYLFIGETPNRLWPQDYHTTGLWWVPYMPLGVAIRYAIARGKIPADATVGWALGEGIRGGLYWEVVRALGPEARCLNRVRGDDVAAFWTRTMSRPGQSRRRLALKRAFFAVHRWVNHWLLRPAGIPAVALLPELSLCLTKVPYAK